MIKLSEKYKFFFGMRNALKGLGQSGTITQVEKWKQHPL